jgi:hypothetical protein
MSGRATRSKKAPNYDETKDDEKIARQLQEEEDELPRLRGRKKSKYEEAQFEEPVTEHFERESRRERKKPERFVEVMLSPQKSRSVK